MGPLAMQMYTDSILWAITGDPPPPTPPRLVIPDVPSYWNSQHLDTISTAESDVEFVRRKRLERLASNLSTNSPDNRGAQNRPWRTSLPGAPPHSLMLASPQSNTATHTLPQTRSQSVCTFELDDMVMVKRRDAAPWRGVVRWIGELPDTQGQPVAGIEVVCTLLNV